ncbi:hypothetical protein [Nocardia cyriacigeorgica]|uniref:Uncharacterized protein n=1 Tax=Nocardia cyriacigeorgica (strain GUH-2) TaxID=1127134 RepID=H6R4I4_NOCCG|nr:hypothetical protein [Nocardia cyriacigeorgica]BDT85473.1 hypothetical protein FMUAM8_12370 [Nocardia cyriacigeorgica]CCF62053.1 exported protein of unknown function [Nocardia cyriacigeorgica GUH-2]
MNRTTALARTRRGLARAAAVAAIALAPAAVMVAPAVAEPLMLEPIESAEPAPDASADAVYYGYGYGGYGGYGYGYPGYGGYGYGYGGYGGYSYPNYGGYYLWPVIVLPPTGSAY